MQLSAEGDFRRPLTDSFAPTTASQTIAINTPALMFAATTLIVPGIWAHAYDSFAEGEMEMRAKIVSTLTVVDESATNALNRISLRRWLLESPLYPTALLPGGPVRWEAIDDSHARAIVSGSGLESSLVATFRPDGSLPRSDDALSWLGRIRYPRRLSAGRRHDDPPCLRHRSSCRTIDSQAISRFGPGVAVFGKSLGASHKAMCDKDSRT